MLSSFHKFNFIFRKKSFLPEKGQSAVELAIFGSILMFVVAMIFRQGLNGGNYMNTQLKATRYALSKSFETSQTGKPGRNNASVLIIEDRLGGDFINKFGTRDRTPLIAGGGGTLTNQLFYPKDKTDCEPGNWKVAGIAACDDQVLNRYDVVINGQKFSFTTENFRVIDLPVAQGTIANCGTPHPTDTRCWNPACAAPGGCVALHTQVQNYPGGEYIAGAANNAFDPKFDNNYVPAVMRPAILAGVPPLRFMWQWAQVDAVGDLTEKGSLDVDGDFYEERILDTDIDVNNRVVRVLVIDRQAGDIDFTIDGRRPTARSGLLDDSQMFSYTSNGTVYEVREGKLYNPRNDRYIRNVNRNDQVDVVQRVIQLSNNTGRFCDVGGPKPLVDGTFNPVEACSNDCFNALNIQKTCLHLDSGKLFVRSRIVNKGGRSWFTQTEKRP